MKYDFEKKFDRLIDKVDNSTKKSDINNKSIERVMILYYVILFSFVGYFLYFVIWGFDNLIS